MPLSAGTRLGPYEIVSTLGAGGMGEVYRVRDPRLQRDVALKVLASPMASDPDRLERFGREARAVASLNHPNIVTIHSTEEADGVRFLTMELVEGQGLDRLIGKGALSLAQFFDIAIPLADAVRAAHEKNITHRDLKPANVMIDEDGRVKVLDFGLARFTCVEPRVADETRLNLTSEGTVVGTPAYMSPEQIEGKAVDHRSDLFSLAVVLYEMLSGERPFTGDSSAGIMSSILRDVARPIQQLRSDVPASVAAVITRSLEKRPGARLQTARELRDELKAARNLVESTSVAGERQRQGTNRAPAAEGNVAWIAVLPFACQTSDADAEALAVGLTEEITTGLSRFSYLSVLAGKQPGARYALEGRVRRAGASVRINVHLVDTRSGAHLWSETYNADLKAADLFVVQDDVTDRVVATVADAHGVLIRAMAQAIRDKPAAELGSRDLTLRYWGYHQHHRPEEHAVLRDAFERLVAGEPDGAEAWASLAHLYVHEHAFGFNPQADPLQRAERAAHRAVDLDAASQLAWAALATTYFFKHDREGFLHALERAIAINPRNTDTAAWLATLLTHMGEHERGREISSRAMALNPHHPGWYHFEAFHRHYDRAEFGEALAAAKKFNMPGHLWAPYAVAVAAGQLGRAEETAAALAAFAVLAPELAANEHALRTAAGRWKWTEAAIEHEIEGFRKARELSLALAAPLEASDEAPSIAVLPFANMSSDPEQEYFSDGLTEEIINALAQIRGLKVIARTSAFAFKGQNVQIGSIAQALGVSHVLEGSVRRSGRRIRVTAQLVTAADGCPLWSERYDRDLADIFAVQDDIASAIVRELRGRLAIATTPSPAYRPSLPAYEAFLMARHHVWRHSTVSFAQALESYQEAIALDPGYADPHVGIAELLHIRASFRGAEAQEAARGIRPALERALALDPAHAEANAWLGVLASTYEYDWKEAADRFRMMTAAEPISPRVRHLDAYFFRRHIGQADKAVEAHHRALQEDPLNLIMRVGLAASLTSAGRHDEASREAHRLLELAPDFAAAYTLLPLDVTREPLQVALDYAERLHARSPWCAGGIGLYAGLLCRAGEEQRGRALLNEIGSADEYGSAVDFALYCLARGETDAAFEHLLRLTEQRHPFLMMVLVGGPYGTSLRSSAHWPVLARQIGLS